METGELAFELEQVRTEFAEYQCLSVGYEEELEREILSLKSEVQQLKSKLQNGPLKVPCCDCYTSFEQLKDTISSVQYSRTLLEIEKDSLEVKLREKEFEVVGITKLYNDVIEELALKDTKLELIHTQQNSKKEDSFTSTTYSYVTSKTSALELLNKIDNSFHTYFVKPSNNLLVT